MNNTKLDIRLGLFAQDILILISAGCKETFDEIEEHFFNEDTVEYLYSKYKDQMSVDWSRYDTKKCNKLFFDIAAHVRGKEHKEHGLSNENDGLLLVVSLILGEMREKTRIALKQT